MKESADQSLFTGKSAHATPWSKMAEAVFDSAILLAIATGLLFCIGFQVLSGYLTTFGVDPFVMSFSVQETLLFGISSTSPLIPFLLPAAGAASYWLIRKLFRIFKAELTWWPFVRKVTWSGFLLFLVFNEVLIEEKWSAVTYSEEMKKCFRTNRDYASSKYHIFRTDVSTANDTFHGYPVLASSKQITLYDPDDNKAQVIPTKDIHRMETKSIAPFDRFKEEPMPSVHGIRDLFIAIFYGTCA